MPIKILICGLPGAGKTTLAQELASVLAAHHSKQTSWFNADLMRKSFNDWDFSPEGRKRQAQRMRSAADASTSAYAICDFVAPTQELRDLFGADITIWVDTIEQGRFADTNRLFEAPSSVTFRVTTQDAVKNAQWLAEKIVVHQHNRLGTEHVAVSLPRPLFDAVSSIATGRGLAVESVIITAITEYLDSINQKPA